jgi:hypothetical protein
MATTVPSLDLNTILQGIPRGAWVAISRSEKRVVAFGADMQKVLEEAKGKGENSPVIVRVPEAETALML